MSWRRSWRYRRRPRAPAEGAAVWLAVALVLGGCGAGPTGPPAWPQVRAAVVPGAMAPQSGVLELEAVAASPVAGVDIVGADVDAGAAAIETAPIPVEPLARPPQALGAELFGSVGPIEPIGRDEPPPLLVRSRATVPIRDLEAYRRTWPQLRLRIRLAGGGDLVVAAPPPPAPS